MDYSFHKNIEQHNCDQHCWWEMFLEQHIKVISEGSCDTENTTLVSIGGFFKKNTKSYWPQTLEF